MNYVIASSIKLHAAMAERLAQASGRKFIYLDKKEDLTPQRLAAIGPRYVFFPHWSHIIPETVFRGFECVIFHMTDVPFGRGGSPLQNLISRKIYETKISAIRCVEEFDAGPVYMKKPLSLHGNAEEILLRAGTIMEAMIAFMIANEPVPEEQRGDPVVFRRRHPEDGDVSKLKDIVELYDYIRMLDAEGYPKAFLEAGLFRLEFQRAALKSDGIVADVRIVLKGGQ